MPKRAMASRVEAAVVEIAARRAALRRAIQLAREKCRGFAMHFDERGALLIFAPLLRRAFARRGMAMPHFSATVRTDSGNAHLSISITNLKTSPPTPQPKQW